MTDVTPEIEWGTVVGRVMSIRGDGTDLDDAPDMAPMQGTVTLTPRVNVARLTIPTSRITLLTQPIVCTLADGYLTGPDGKRGVRVMASDAAFVQPTGIQYTVTYQLRGDSGYPLEKQPTSMTITVPKGTTVDLTEVMPETEKPAMVQVVTSEDRDAAEAAAVAAAASAATASRHATTAANAATRLDDLEQVAQGAATVAQTAADAAKATAAAAATTQQQLRDANAAADAAKATVADARVVAGDISDDRAAAAAAATGAAAARTDAETAATSASKSSAAATKAASDAEAARGLAVAARDQATQANAGAGAARDAAITARDTATSAAAAAAAARDVSASARDEAVAAFRAMPAPSDFATVVLGVELGAIVPWPHAPAMAPAGLLLCDGRLVSRAQYKDLFDLIGTRYGAGDGSTTFAVPDYRGRALVGVDATQTEFDVLGEVGGSKTHTLTTAEMPSHTHVQNSHTHAQFPHTHIQNAHNHGTDPHSHGQQVSANDGGTAIRNDYTSDQRGGVYPQGVQTDQAWVNIHWTTPSNQNATAVNESTTAVNQSTGSGQAHNNLSPYRTIHWLIKATRTTVSANIAADVAAADASATTAATAATGAATSASTATSAATAASGSATAAANSARAAATSAGDAAVSAVAAARAADKGITIEALAAETGEIVYTNAVTNPSLEVNATSWSSSSGGVTTRRTDGGMRGAGYVRCTWGAKPAGWSYFITAHMPLPAAGVGSTGSLWVRSTTVTQLVARIWWYSETGAGLGGAEGPLTALTPGVWTRIDVSAVAPAGATQARFGGHTPAASFPAGGGELDVDAAMLVFAPDGSAAPPPVLDYFDGDHPLGYWVGAPHASTSRGIRPAAQTSAKIHLAQSRAAQDAIAARCQPTRTAPLFVYRADRAPEEALHFTLDALLWHKVVTQLSSIDWTYLTLSSGWQVYGGVFSTPSCYRTPTGVVGFRGLLKGGTGGEISTPAPAEMRPAVQRMFPTLDGPTATIKRIDASATGTLTASFTGSTWSPLDRIVFNNDPSLVWNPITLKNGFRNFDPLWHPAEYAIDQYRRVWLRGVIAANSAPADGTVMFTLPAAPARGVHMLTTCVNSVGTIRVRSNGDVDWVAASSGVGYFSLEGMFVAADAPGTWAPVALASPWSNYGGTAPATYETAESMRFPDGLVKLKGLITGGTVGTASIVGTITAGHAPKVLALMPTLSGNLGARIDINPNGVINHTPTNQGWTSLDCHYFAEG